MSNVTVNGKEVRFDSIPRAPEKKRSPIIRFTGNHINTDCPKAVSLVKRAEACAEDDALPELPAILPRAFVEDVVEWGIVYAHSQYGHLGDRGPHNYQEDLSDYWPEEWMLWAFLTIGYLKYEVIQ